MIFAPERTCIHISSRTFWHTGLPFSLSEVDPRSPVSCLALLLLPAVAAVAVAVVACLLALRRGWNRLQGDDRSVAVSVLNLKKILFLFFLTSRVLGFRVHHPFQGPLTHLCDLEAGYGRGGNIIPFSLLFSTETGKHLFLTEITCNRHPTSESDALEDRNQQVTV